MAKVKKTFAIPDELWPEIHELEGYQNKISAQLDILNELKAEEELVIKRFWRKMRAHLLNSGQVSVQPEHLTLNMEKLEVAQLEETGPTFKDVLRQLGFEGREP